MFLILFWSFDKIFRKILNLRTAFLILFGARGYLCKEGLPSQDIKFVLRDEINSLLKMGQPEFKI